MTGNPGTGKTFVIKLIVRKCRLEARRFDIETGDPVTIVAFMAIAASNFDTGLTIHSTFAILDDKLRDLSSMKNGEGLAIIQNCKNMRILVVDEISMVQEKQLKDMSCRLCSTRSQTGLFGDIDGIIFAGGFEQLEPPIGKSLIKVMLFPPGEFAMSEFLRSFHRTQLTEQERGRGDPNQVEQVNNICDYNNNWFPFRKLVLRNCSHCIEAKEPTPNCKHWHELTIQDIQRDYRWTLSSHCMFGTHSALN